MNLNWKFTCPLSNKKKAEYKFYNSVSEVPRKDWETINQDKNVYLSIPYLEAMEDSMSSEILFRYIIFYDDQQQPIAISAVQLVDFKDSGSKYSELIGKVGNTLLNTLKIKVMICGNVFSCGENGFMFSEAIEPEKAYNLLVDALFKLRNNETNDNKVSILLLKEFWPQSFDQMESLKSNHFSDFMIDVNMVLNIHPSWNNVDDYLQSMVTKFRTKAKSVFKKSKDVEVRDLTASDIEHYKTWIQSLYSNVVDHADFNFGKLTADAFLRIKQNLNDRFVVKGYFLNDELIGFSTAFLSDKFVDANYVGLNYDYNHQYALYQKMLYDYVALAINEGSEELRLGRTAEEIKSCLGAQPTNMKLFVRHKNTVSNHLLKPIVDSISPSEFELRKPFKASFRQA